MGFVGIVIKRSVHFNRQLVEVSHPRCLPMTAVQTRWRWRTTPPHITLSVSPGDRHDYSSRLPAVRFGSNYCLS